MGSSGTQSSTSGRYGCACNDFPETENNYSKLFLDINQFSCSRLIIVGAPLTNFTINVLSSFQFHQHTFSGGAFWMTEGIEGYQFCVWKAEESGGPKWRFKISGSFPKQSLRWGVLTVLLKRGAMNPGWTRSRSRLSFKLQDLVTPTLKNTL